MRFRHARRATISIGVIAVVWGSMPVTADVVAQVPPTTTTASTTTTTASTTTTTSAPTGHLVVEPATGGTGDTVTVTGTGCLPPGASFVVALEPFPSAPHQGVMATGTTDGTGSFSVTATIPRFLSGFLHAPFPTFVVPGSYEVIAGEQATFEIVKRCSAPFQVTAGGPLPLVISPTSGPPGTTILVAPDCPEIYPAHVRAEVGGTTVPGTEQTQSVGGPHSSTIPVTLPTDLPPGTNVDITGSCANVTYAPVMFVVTAAAVEGNTVSPPAQPPAQPVVAQLAMTE